MSQARHHVIRRQCIDLAVEGSESDGFALQGRLATLCQGELTAALDEAFARVAPGDEHWQLERIEVDAGHFTPEGFARDFVAAVAAAVEEQVRVRKAQAIAQPRLAADEGDLRWSGAQSLEQAFCCFLVTGALPWWCRLPEGRTLESILDEAWSQAQVQGQGETLAVQAPWALTQALAAPIARWRLARQFSGEFVGRVLERLAPGALAVLRDVVTAVRRELSLASTAPLPEQAWVAAMACAVARQTIAPRQLLDAWAVLSPELITPAVSAGVIRAIAAHAGGQALEDHGRDSASAGHQAATSNTAPAGTGREDASATPTPAAALALVTPAVVVPAEPLDLREGVFIDCAGVVLLHPFLPHLFERLRIVADGRLLQPDRALALLHFLATGQRSAPEHALVLPKLLCGMEPSDLAGPPLELSEAECKEAENLLQAAIDYWPAIGQTSFDGLRGNFLVRPGKLSKRGDDDLLQIEKRAWDVLLGQLPWGIGVVNLPWMRRMLWVEWPY